jgi:8-oxo-dGTP pyrophosphatase MutT (NUDIX family)
VDSTDASLIAAALREAQEEVAIPPSCVEVIGVLPPVDSDRFPGHAGGGHYPAESAVSRQR